EFGCPNDTDKDGFADHLDQCPNEADLGLGIDAVGCPILDSDNDGLTDDIDSCPFEGDAGFGVDGDGCPIGDNDGDGYTDNIDDCPSEGDIFGFGVDGVGCPICDADNDGVGDNVDQCPQEGDLGYGVDANGCPVDSDGDGFADHNDACPNDGDYGFGVDGVGCPTDDDGDGYPDHVDLCPTDDDAGFGVDSNGCPNPAPNPDPVPDTDGDGVVDNTDLCPADGGIVDANGCPLDTDGDGVVDNNDLCPTEGDLGFGIDANGCPNPDPEITPIVVVVNPDAVAINMSITATCQTTDSGVVALFELTNPNESDINHGYTDQNGVAGVANVPAGSTASVTIIPNNDGYASIKFDNVANFAEITCEMPQPTPEVTEAPPVLLPTLSIRNEACITQGTPRMVIDIFNAGPGVLPAGTEFITTNNSQFILDMDVAPNSSYSMAVFVINGFGSLQIPAYNFSYANTVACPPPPPTPEVTPPTELAPRMVVAGETCTQNNSGDPVIILDLRNDGTAPLPTGTQFLINNDSPYNLDRDIAVGGTLSMTVFMRDGFGVFQIPSLGFYYTNLNPCPAGSAPDNTVRIRVLETTCNAGAGQYQLRIINDGPGIIAAGTEIIFTRYLSNGNNPTSTTNFGANVAAGADARITVFVGDLGITQVSIPAYNFSFTNDVPCTNNAVTGLQLVSATCEPGPNFAPNYPGVRFELRNFGPNPIPAGLAYTLEGYNNEPGTTGVEIPVGGDFVTGVLATNSGFARLVIPSLNINVQNPTRCVPPATNFSVSNYTCSFNNRGDAVVSYVITNTGPNLVSGIHALNIAGLETQGIEIRSAIGGDLPVNGTLTITARPDGNGFVTTSIPALGFTASNPTACPPPMPTLSVSAQCVGEYQGEISITLAGFNQFAMSDIAMFADGVPFRYEIQFDDTSIFASGTPIYADGTYTIPYTSENSWRGRQVGFIHDTVRNLIGADNSADSIVLPLCVPEHVDYSVNISQSCDAQTGINTVTLTATNVISLNRALTFLNAPSDDIRRYYQFIGTGLAPLNEQYHVSEGVSVYEFNTNGKDALSVNYFNPILVNINAQRQLGIVVARQNVDEYLSVPLELCGNPETPIQPDPAVTILSIQCIGEYLGEIEIGFANFNNFIVNGQEPFLGGFDYFYGIRDANADLYLINDTVRYEDGTFIITFTAQLDWRGRTLYFDYQTAQSVVEGTVATTTHPVALPDCLPQLPPDFGINVSQSCNPETGINTVTFTPINFASYQELFILANTDPSGAGLDQYMVGTNRGIQYFTITADPVTVDVDTNGATIAAVGYPDPDFINYYLRYIILGAENAGPQPTSMNPLVQIPIDTCGVPPEPVELGEVKALEPTFTCDNISQELVIDFGLLTPAELQTVLASFLQSSGGGISAETGLMMFAIVQGSFVPINYFIHSGEYNPNGSFIQSGIHSPLDSGDLTLRIPYNLLAGGNTFLTYIDFQPLLSYMLDVFEAQLKGENPDNIPQPDFNTVIVTVPLQDCNIPEVVAISGVCTVFNNDRVVMFDVTGFTSNLANYSVNTPNSFLLMGNPPIVAVYPDENGYASIRFGNTGFGEVTCEVEPEVTPEPETTPEAPSESANLQIAISEVCDTTTGIITISFTISGASDLLALLDGNLGNLTPLAYTINDTGYTPLQWQDGIQTAQYNSLSRAGTLQYTNPAYLNYMVNGILSNSALDNPPPQFVAYTLTPCSISTEFTIPQAPTPVLQSLTCETPGQLVLTIDFGDNEAYTKAVDLLLGEIFAVAESAVLGIDNLGVDVTTILDGLSL
ncbi:MAG: MSCRAMM family adhesin SdrC, partial [Anaerolineae bacterium]|nr:MSCRAMM family adhesin SdrC [Anaerolineae bacterium]